jgi:hypothetical protein
MSEQLISSERRRFLGQMTLTAGGLVLAGFAPVSLLQAAPVACLVDASMYPDPCGDWNVDDMCSAYPPYAFNTGPSTPHTVGYVDTVAGADHHWVA